MESYITPADVNTLTNTDLAFKVWFYWNTMALLLLTVILLILGITFQKNAIVLIVVILIALNIVYYGWNYFLTRAINTTDNEQAHKLVLGLIMFVIILYALPVFP